MGSFLVMRRRCGSVQQSTFLKRRDQGWTSEAIRAASLNE